MAAEMKYSVLGDWSQATKQQKEAVKESKRGIKEIAATVKTELKSIESAAVKSKGTGTITAQLTELQGLGKTLGAVKQDLTKAQAAGVTGLTNIVKGIDARLAEIKALETRLINLANKRSPNTIKAGSPIASGSVDRAIQQGQASANDIAARRRTDADKAAARAEQQRLRKEAQARKAEESAEARSAREAAEALRKQKERTERAKAKVEDPQTRQLIDDETAAKQLRRDRNQRVKAETRDPSEEAETKSINQKADAQASTAFAAMQLNPAYAALVAAGNVDARRGNAAQKAADARYSLQDPAAQDREARDVGTSEAEKRLRNARAAAETERQTIPFLREIVKNEAEAEILSRRRAALLRAQTARYAAGTPSLTALEAQANVDTRRNEARRGAEEARYSTKDPLARSAEINDNATADAQKRRDKIAQTLATEEKLAGHVDELARQTAETEKLQRDRKLATRKAVANTYTEAEAQKRAQVLVSEQANAEKQQLELLRAQNLIYQRQNATDKATLKVKNDILIEERRLRAAENQRIKDAVSAGDISGGTRFQRLQQGIAARRGGSARLPEEFQTGKQFLESKALTTAGFAFSGAILYGGIAAIREMIQGASELEKELSIVEAQFISAGRSTEKFGEFRETIIEISKETGKTAAELAKVGRSLLGVFRIRDESKPLEEQDQGPDERAASAALEVSAKFSAVTGVDSKLITDEFVAIFKSFEDVQKGLTFQDLADSLIAVEEESGVAADQLLNIAGSLAPVVSQMGVTTDELIRYSAAATQGSARDASAISDGLNRFLTELPGKTSSILDVYQQSPELGTKATERLQKAIATGDASKVIDQMIRDYQKLSPQLKGIFNESVIGGRNTQSVVGLFENASLALRDIDGKGALDERFEKVRDTLEESMARAAAAVQELASTLFEAGLGDVLKNLAIVAGGLVEAFTALVGILLKGNDLIGGKGTEAIGAVGSAAILMTLFRRGQQADLGSRLRGLGPGAGSGAGTAASGLLGPTGLPIVAGGAPPTPGGFGSRARGFVAANKSLIGLSVAAFGASQLLEARATMQADNQRLQDELDTYSDKKIQKGLDLPEDSNLRKFGQMFSGGKTTRQYYEDQIQKRAASGRRDIVGAIGAQDYEKAIGNVGGFDRYGVKLKDRFADPEALRQEFLDNPEDDDVNKAYEELTKAYEDMGASAAYDEAVKNAAAGDVKVAAGKEAAESLEDAAANVELLIEGLDNGNSTLGEVKAAIGVRTEKLQAMVDGARAAGDPDPELEKQLAESKAQSEEVTDLAFKSYADGIKKILELRGDNGRDGNRQVQALSRFILSSFGTGISQEYRTEVAEELAASQKQEMEFQIGQAKSVNEALTAYRDAIANYDPVARFEVILGQVSGPLYSDQVKAIGGTTEEVANKVQDYLDIGKEESIEALQGQVENWQHLNELMQSDFYDADIARAQAWIQILTAIADPAAYSKDRADATALQGYQNASSVISGNTALQNSLTTDPLAQAKNNEAAAKKILDEAKIYDAQVKTLESGQAVVDALVKYNDSMNNTLKAQDAIDTSELAISAARVAGDPLASARVSKQAADLALTQARGDQNAANAAIAAGIQADTAIRDAQNDIARAQMELAAAQNAGDPVAVAQAQLDIANFNVSAAKGEAERLRALASQISAKRALSEAISEVMSGIYDVAIATRDAAGDVVGSAELQLEKINKLLSAARARGDKSAEVQLLAQKVSAEANLRDTKLGDRQSDIDFALQMEQITTGQAIQQLELLLKIPNLTKQQIQQLQLKIKELRDGSGLSQFNTPDDLNLPTVYEINRLDKLNGGTYQSARAGFEGVNNSVNDNRIITIKIDAKNTIEAEAALKVINDSLGAAPRSGIDYQLY